MLTSDISIGVVRLNPSTTRMGYFYCVVCDLNLQYIQVANL